MRVRCWRFGKARCSQRRSSAALSRSTWRVERCGICWRRDVADPLLRCWNIGGATRSVIASEAAKTSNPESPCGKILDCFVARAPRNDDEESCGITVAALNASGRKRQ
ncbi:hypothetical protein FXB38_23585 [Bradyrhizobium cytisi]|uniref:Uncharacterized protein n=1 Tax=Bradyrhizobium cytisi TaxID=515489 RepID=A0A5S4WII4_9BRAD|nr:hypothetical protein FXB38_23585 [Bradyrhizobium cytisi]